MKPVICPYCGTQMIAHDNGQGRYWYYCQKCAAYSPYGFSAQEAFELAQCRYELQLEPMTLDDVIEKSKHINNNVIWLEQPDEEDPDDTDCLPALISNFSRIGADGIEYVKFLMWPKKEVVFPVIGESGYGETWRCWPRKPTTEELAAVMWS